MGVEDAIGSVSGTDPTGNRRVENGGAAGGPADLKIDVDKRTEKKNRGKRGSTRRSSMDLASALKEPTKMWNPNVNEAVPSSPSHMAVTTPKKLKVFGEYDMRDVIDNNLRSPLDLKTFGKFCQIQRSQESLAFLLIVKKFKKSAPVGEEYIELAKMITRDFIMDDGQRSVNVGYNLRGSILASVATVQASNPDYTIFDEAEKEIYHMLKIGVFRRFRQMVSLQGNINYAEDVALWFLCRKEEGSGADGAPAGRGGGVSKRKFSNDIEGQNATAESSSSCCQGSCSSSVANFFTYPSPLNDSHSRILELLNCLMVAGGLVEWSFAQTPVLFSVALLGAVLRALFGPRLDWQSFLVIFALEPLFKHLKLMTPRFVPNATRRYAEMIWATLLAAAVVTAIMQLTIPVYAISGVMILVGVPHVFNTHWSVEKFFIKRLERHGVIEKHRPHVISSRLTEPSQSNWTSISKYTSRHRMPSHVPESKRGHHRKQSSNRVPLNTASPESARSRMHRAPRHRRSRPALLGGRSPSRSPSRSPKPGPGKGGHHRMKSISGRSVAGVSTSAISVASPGNTPTTGNQNGGEINNPARDLSNASANPSQAAVSPSASEGVGFKFRPRASVGTNASNPLEDETSKSGSISAAVVTSTTKKTHGVASEKPSGPTGTTQERNNGAIHTRHDSKNSATHLLTATVDPPTNVDNVTDTNRDSLSTKDTRVQGSEGQTSPSNSSRLAPQHEKQPSLAGQRLRDRANPDAIRSRSSSPGKETKDTIRYGSRVCVEVRG